MHVNAASRKTRVFVFLRDFLFKNQSGKQTVVKNSFWLFAAQGCNGLLTFFLSIYLAREFGSLGFGQFSFALSFVMLFSTLFDFGLTTALTRELAVDSENEQYFLDVFFLKFLIGLLAVGLVFIASFFVSNDLIVMKMMWCLAFYQLFFESLNLFYSYFRARQKVEFEAAIRFFQMFNLVFVLIIMMHFWHAISYAAFAYAVSACMTILITTFFVMRTRIQLNRVPWRLRFEKCKSFLWIGWYLALAKGAGDVMVNTDTFLMGYWDKLGDAGLYNAAMKVSALLLFPMSMVSAAIFPALIVALKNSPSEFFKYWQGWVKITLFFVGFFTFYIFVEAEAVMSFFYGAAYSHASSVLIVLTIMAAILYVGNLFYHVSLMHNQQKTIFYLLLVTSSLNVVLNVLLIPRYGMMGSAFATVCAQLMNMMCYAMMISKRTIVRPFDFYFLKNGGYALLFGSLMFLVLMGLKQIVEMPFILNGILAVLIYLGLVFSVERKNKLGEVCQP